MIRQDEHVGHTFTGFIHQQIPSFIIPYFVNGYELPNAYNQSHKVPPLYYLQFCTYFQPGGFYICLHLSVHHTVSIIIDREAREIIRLVASVCPSVCPSAKGPVKHKSATLLKNIIEYSSKGAFKMVGHSNSCCFDRLRQRGR